MQYFSYTDKREVLHQEYSQHPIIPSPDFQWVVNQQYLQVVHMAALSRAFYSGGREEVDAQNSNHLALKYGLRFESPESAERGWGLRGS